MEYPKKADAHFTRLSKAVQPQRLEVYFVYINYILIYILIFIEVGRASSAGYTVRMKWLDFTYKQAAANIACDDCLLDDAENGRSGEVLRFWEPQSVFAVLGISNEAQKELNMSAIEQDGIPVIRRCSGGGAVLQFPGCLNYSLVLEINRHPELQNVVTTNQWVMSEMADAINEIHPKVEVRGCTDLVLDNLKFSGNAQRRKSRFSLFHGCILLEVDYASVEKYLSHPSKEPKYRQARSHSEFITHLSLDKKLLTMAIQKKWQAFEAAAPPPQQALEEVLQSKYTNPDWNFKR